MTDHRPSILTRLNPFFRPPHPFQEQLVDACHYLGLQANGFGVWNPCLTRPLPVGRAIFIQLNDGFVPATQKIANRTIHEYQRRSAMLAEYDIVLTPQLG